MYKHFLFLAPLLFSPIWDKLQQRTRPLHHYNPPFFSFSSYFSQMNPDYSNDDCVCESDTAALGYCKLHSVPLSELIKHLDFDVEPLEDKTEAVEENKQ